MKKMKMKKLIINNDLHYDLMEQVFAFCVGIKDQLAIADHQTVDQVVLLLKQLINDLKKF